MAIFNRVVCPGCAQNHNVYKKNIKEIVCTKCGSTVKINARDGNFFIENYFNGRRIRQKVGKSRSLAEVACQKRKVEIAEGKFLDKKKVDKIKFEDFAQEFFEVHSKPNNRSEGKFAFAVIRILKKTFSGYYLTEITPLMIEKFKSERIKEVSPASVNRFLTILKSIFNKAIDWGKYHGVNPVTKVNRFKENNERVRFLEKNEIVELLSVCRGNLKAIIMVALNTGMRKGEILSLKWRDCDFKRDVIYLRDTKNGEAREVPINEQVKTTLIRVRKHPKCEYIFCKQNGDRLKDIRTSFFTALDNSDITNFRFHDLRHTFASHLVMGGIDVNTVRELLGHKSLVMTLRYSHLSPNHKKNAVDLLSKQMESVWSVEMKPAGKLVQGGVHAKSSAING